jgi:hypothetical protein
MSNNNESKAQDYARSIAAQYCAFLRTTGLNPMFYDMDVDTLRVVIKRYLDDVDRIHRYHAIEKIDCYKIAGYITYWFCRLKPIRVVDKRAAYKQDIKDDAVRKIASKSFYINELFAMFLELGRINAHHNRIKNVFDSDFINTFTYSLKYRLITGDMLALMYGIIDRSAP